MFPECSYDEWRAKVEADLKGADFNKKLVWRTNEGFNVQPVYRAENIADFKTTDSFRVNILTFAEPVPTTTGLSVRRFLPKLPKKPMKLPATSSLRVLLRSALMLHSIM